ncbi:MAG: prepilin-type N-terminal cleavage/methylation domain-containing protein, partial [Candidatus Paceibacterota bacterium]
MNLSKPHKGFTLIELLIVIGIVAVLAVVVLTVLNPVEF